MTSLYRAVIYRFDCNRLRPVEPEEDIVTSRFSSNHAPSDREMLSLGSDASMAISVV